MATRETSDSKDPWERLAMMDPKETGDPRVSRASRDPRVTREYQELEDLSDQREKKDRL